MRWPKVLVLLASFVAGALLPSLVGCSAGQSTIGRVMDVIQRDHVPLDAEAQHQLVRFQKVYDTYSAKGNRDRHLKHFSDAFRRVRVHYVNPITDKELVDSAIKGIEEMEPAPTAGAVEPGKLIEAALDSMLTSLDPHSGYLNRDEFKEVGVTTKGEFGGLGIQVTMEDGYVKVISPIEDTPAYKAGLKAGDLITHLDGTPIKGITLAQAVKRMRGKPGTRILLTIKRGDKVPFDVGIVRAIVVVKAVRWRAEGNIGYVRLTRFNGKARAGIDAAMQEIHKTLGPALKGVVLDLRSNPGGLLDQSVAVSDAFLDAGLVVSVKDSHGRRNYEAQSGDLAAGLPVVVLINGGSASASEIVAGALQDHRRAIVMGMRSFGKGTVQTVLPLPEEGGLRLTTQLYYTPLDRSIQALGVEPDIVLTPEEKQEVKVEEEKKAAAKRRREADLPGAIQAQNRLSGRTLATLEATDCPVIKVEKEGGKEDHELGCALQLLRAGSPDAFLAQHRAAGHL